MEANLLLPQSISLLFQDTAGNRAGRFHFFKKGILTFPVLFPLYQVVYFLFKACPGSTSLNSRFLSFIVFLSYPSFPLAPFLPSFLHATHTIITATSKAWHPLMC